MRLHLLIVFAVRKLVSFHKQFEELWERFVNFFMFFLFSNSFSLVSVHVASVKTHVKSNCVYYFWICGLCIYNVENEVYGESFSISGAKKLLNTILRKCLQ